MTARFRVLGCFLPIILALAHLPYSVADDAAELLPMAPVDWTHVGGPAGTYAYVLEAVSSNPAIVYCGTAEGLYKSSNRGNTWRVVLPGRAIRFVLIDQNRPDTLYASDDHRLYRSSDGAARWRQVSLPGNGIGIDDIVIAASNPAVLYAGTEEALYRSDDGGARWQRIKSLRHVGFSPVVLALDPRRPDTLYASLGGELHKSTNGGRDWISLGGGSARRDYRAIVVDPLSSQIVYAADYDGVVIRSDDAGANWELVNPDQHLGTPGGFICDPTASGRIYYAGDFGFYLSEDFGATWTRRNAGVPEDGLNSAVIVRDQPRMLLVAAWNGVSSSTDEGRAWKAQSDGMPYHEVRSLLVDPGNPDVLHATTYGGLYRTTTEGDGWVYEGLHYVDQLIIHPRSHRTWFAMDYYYSYRSTDSGRTWARLREPGDGEGIESIAIDPLKWRIVYAGGQDGGLYRSTDGASSWRTVGGGLVAGYRDAIRALAIDASQRSTLYAGTEGGVFKSVDSGRLWVQSSYDEDIQVLALDQTDGRKLYAATRTGLIRSDDAAETWTQARLRVAGINAIALDPEDTSVIYAAAGCVFMSADGGDTWQKATRGISDLSVQTLATGPAGKVYAGTNSGGIYMLDPQGAEGE